MHQVKRYANDLYSTKCRNENKTMKNILLIEDEQNIAALIKKGLEEEALNVDIANEGFVGLNRLTQSNYDLIILDIILPDTTGFEICKKIRDLGYKNLPILMLTALGTTDNVVLGLNSGADDYLTKPFEFKELLARMQALMRRSNNIIQKDNSYVIADLKLNLDQKVAFRHGEKIKLTATEFRLLEYFMKNKNKVLSRNDLLENVWDINFEMGTNVVDVYVNYLRNKIDKNFDNKLIHTIVGMGYMLKEEN